MFQANHPDRQGRAKHERILLIPFISRSYNAIDAAAMGKRDHIYVSPEYARKMAAVACLLESRRIDQSRLRDRAGLRRERLDSIDIRTRPRIAPRQCRREPALEGWLGVDQSAVDQQPLDRRTARGCDGRNDFQPAAFRALDREPGPLRHEVALEPIGDTHSVAGS